MRSLIVALGIVVVFNNISVIAKDDLYVPGIRSLAREGEAEGPTTTTTTTTPATPPAATCSGFFGPKCADCRTLLTCADVTINKQSCSFFSSDQPYCVNNTCSATKPKGVCSIYKNFRCTSEGSFPDSDNCEKYFYCIKDAGIFNAVSFDCPPTYVYDSPTGLCKKKASPNDCKLISCTNNLNRYQILTFDKSILVYCADTIEYKETLLFRCKDPINMEWDLNSLACKFVCKAEGRYADAEDCHSYYDCIRNGTSLNFTKSSCPQGFKFDGNSKMCSLGNC